MEADSGASKQGLVGAPHFDWQRGKVGPDAHSAVSLRPQSLAVLKMLYDNAGRAVTKDQLMEKVWPNVAVTDDSLVQCITEIRKALGHSNRDLIKTLPKRGYIFEGPANLVEVAGIPPKSSPSKSWVLPVVLAMGISAVALSMLRSPQPKSVELPAIAVLPFNNLGSDPKGDKFAEMMTEDVITDLSHSKDFAVIARNSTDVYKGKPVDARAVGHDLNVKYVLEGSVEALPGRVRATAQLINTATNSHVWSERFEGQGDDIFAVEADVTNRIATSILSHDAAVANSERSLIRRKPPQQWSAYDAYQAGLEASHKMSAADLPKAEEMFSKAIAIDPNFARAHLGLAWLNLLKLLFGNGAPDVALAKMLTEATKAAALDPDDGEAHAALAQVYSLLHDQPRMAAEVDRALNLAPNNADILVLTSAFLLQTDRAELAMNNISRALKLNPNYPFWYNTTLFADYFYAGNFAKSYDYAREAAKTATVNTDFLAMITAQLGKTEESAQARNALMKTDPAWSVERLLTNFGNYSGPRELDNLVTGATKAGLRICLTKDELVTLPNAIQIKQCEDLRKAN